MMIGDVREAVASAFLEKSLDIFAEKDSLLQKYCENRVLYLPGGDQSKTDAEDKKEVEKLTKKAG